MHLPWNKLNTETRSTNEIPIGDETCSRGDHSPKLGYNGFMLVHLLSMPQFDRDEWCTSVTVSVLE